MYKSIILAVFIFCGSVNAPAQYYTNQNKVWAFGFGAGLDFTSGVPVPFVSNLATNEGTASVSDAAGNLLFYTNGNKVYNRTGAVMPYGSGITSYSTNSTTQAAVIVPVIDSIGVYYIFSLEEAGSSLISSRLLYSKVDMALDGGMGDVEHSARGILMDTFLSEKMTVVPGNACDIWLLVHQRRSMQFLAFNISSTGVSAPVPSTVGSYSTGYINIFGAMVCSSGRRKIATASSDAPRGLELFDFDPLTGIVSNRTVLDSMHSYYGVEFSPDNTKLYAEYDEGGSSGSRIDQYDITYSSTVSIIASRSTVAVGSIGAITQLKLGPDGKIYLNRFSDLSSSFMDVFNSPNLAGGLSGYAPHAVALSTGTYGFLGMPNVFVLPGMGHPTTFNVHDTFVCLHPGDTITVHAHDLADSYEWYDGTPGTDHFIHAYGSFWVAEGIGCASTVDTIKVIPRNDSLYTHSDTLVCVRTDNDSCILTAPSGYYYLWYDGSTDSFNTVYAGGDYRVAYTVGCSRIFDTIHAIFKNYPGPISGPGHLCLGDSITLNDPTMGGVWASSDAAIAVVGSDNGIVTGILPGPATISYMGTSGCNETKNVIVLAPPCISGIEETTANNNFIEVFPNPAGSEFTVSFNCAISSGASVSINDISGRRIHTYSLSGPHTEISIADLPSGLYQCVLAINGQAQVCKKLVVLR